MLKTISNLVGRNMAYIVLIVAIIAFFGPSGFTWAIPQIGNLLAVIMLGMGMTTSAKDFEAVIKKPKIVILGVFMQYSIMPLLALSLASIFGLPKEIAIGVILVGTCPGGTSSNVISYLARGDVPLSLSMTIVSTLLSPLVTPALTLLLAGQWIEIPFYGMFLSIVKIVLAPVILGILLKHYFSRIVSKITEALPIVSLVGIVLIVGAVVGANADRIASSGVLVMLVVILHNLLGYGVGYVGAKLLKLNNKQSRTVSIEVGMQNSGLATSLAVAHFNPSAAIAGALFSVWHNISGSIMANIWTRKQKLSS